MRRTTGPGATDDELPPAAYAAALASVPGVGPRGLRLLLDGTAAPVAWADLVDGRAHPGVARWASAAKGARTLDVAAVWSAHRDAGVAVTGLDDPGYPVPLAADTEAPAVLFSVGDLSAASHGPRVAIVGTRSATRYGLGVAAQLGAELAAAGITIVSGLALGIDGAAHEGALAAWRAAQGPGGGGAASGSVSGPAGLRAGRPVAVVAGSVASPYPRQHAGLWHRVAECGVVLSEAPLGSADLAWRFPQRNRIMAALADVVVVVECHLTGGSMHTVQAAARRGVPVGAVPGSIRSPASAGTNALLADGCFVVRDASDVMVAVSLATAATTAAPLGLPGVSAPEVASPAVPARQPPAGTGLVAWAAAAESSGNGEPAPAPAPGAAAPAAAAAPEPGHPGHGGPVSEVVLDALGWERCSMDQLLRRTGFSLDALAVTLEHLRARGAVQGAGGSWERAAPGSPNLSGP